MRGQDRETVANEVELAFLFCSGLFCPGFWHAEQVLLVKTKTTESTRRAACRLLGHLVAILSVHPGATVHGTMVSGWKGGGQRDE